MKHKTKFSSSTRHLPPISSKISCKENVGKTKKGKMEGQKQKRTWNSRTNFIFYVRSRVSSSTCRLGLWKCLCVFVGCICICICIYNFNFIAVVVIFYAINDVFECMNLAQWQRREQQFSFSSSVFSVFSHSPG